MDLHSAFVLSTIHLIVTVGTIKYITVQNIFAKGYLSPKIYQAKYKHHVKGTEYNPLIQNTLFYQTDPLVKAEISYKT